MNDNITKPEPVLTQKPSRLLILSLITLSSVVVICAMFGLFVGVRFLSFIERTEHQRISISETWPESGFEQLQHMNATIKQELDIILDQRQENMALQAEVKELTKSLVLAQNTHQAPLPSLVQGWK